MGWDLSSRDVLVSSLGWRGWILVLGCVHSCDSIWMCRLSYILGNGLDRERLIWMSIFRIGWRVLLRLRAHNFAWAVLAWRLMIFQMGWSKWDYSQQFQFIYLIKSNNFCLTLSFNLVLFDLNYSFATNCAYTYFEY